MCFLHREAGRGENPISNGKHELEVWRFNKLVEKQRQYATQYKMSRKNYGKFTQVIMHWLNSKLWTSQQTNEVLNE